MKSHIKTAAILASALSAPFFASASEPSAPEPDGTKSDSRIVVERTSPAVAEIVDRAKSHEVSHTVHAPAFAIHTRDNIFVATIGGEINPILGFDIGNNLYKQDDAGISFVTAAIPVPAVKGHKGDFFINPLNGFVDLTVVGLAGSPNEISGYIKVGTNGINSGLVLQRAYITYRRFTAGMKLTLAQDVYACQPPTIDPEGPSGCVSNVAYEIGYTSKSYNGFRFAAAIDMPTFYSSKGYYRGKDYPQFDDKQVANYRDAEQIIPDVPAWIEYKGKNMNRVRLTGILRNFAYRDLVADKTRHKIGWGVMLSGNVQPVEPLTFYVQAAYGKGIGAYLQDIAGKPLSFIPNDEKPGRMTATPMAGFNFGLSYNPTSKLQFNAMFSESRVWDVRDYASALNNSQNYKYALYSAVNCFYNITPYLQWGIEYLWGRRVIWDKGGANDSRIQTQLAFTF